MAIDPEIEEVLTTLIDTVEERVAEVKALLAEQAGTVQGLAARIEGLGPAGDAAQVQVLADGLARLEQQVQGLQGQQAQINAFLTGLLKLLAAKRLITQQEMVDVYKGTKG